MEERKQRTILIETELHQTLKVVCAQNNLMIKKVVESLIKDFIEKNKK